MYESFYKILGVESSVDSSDLRKAFRRLSKQLHPDTTSLPKLEAAEKFQKICEAYELLSDPLQRAAYDASRDSESSEKDVSLDSSQDLLTPIKTKEVRRPFSGGELFSLLMLFVSLLMCFLIAIGFALINNKELQFRPTWLVINANLHQIENNLKK